MTIARASVADNGWRKDTWPWYAEVQVLKLDFKSACASWVPDQWALAL
jgi:hypothetical protein